MNVLWITNTVFPELSKALGVSLPISGGWMYSLAKQLASQPGLHLAVATVHRSKEYRLFNIHDVTYYVLPTKPTTVYQKELEPYWNKICHEFQPDIIHIHGTEFPHGLACMHACPSQKYIVSVQGLVGICSRYYYAGIRLLEILGHITFRDLVRNDTLFRGKRRFSRLGEYEKEYLQKSHHVIGRTSWDYAHIKAINRHAAYHHCHECLRDDFYDSRKWAVEQIRKYSIFCSQGMHPIKGFHQVLSAVRLLKNEFPDVQIRVAGQDITRYDSLSHKMRLSGYGSILRSAIKANGLQGRITFLGPLTAKQMIEEYLNAHIFICPSSIDNSPNSVGEAQILGVPTIASYVGGIPDMIVPGETGLLYRFEEIEMLAEIIRHVFTSTTLATHISAGGILAAEERHDRLVNLNQMLKIYAEAVL